MLLYFKIANSRSFEDEAELTMIAADYGQVDNTILLDKYAVSILKSSVIYGANASGKSNLLKAIADGVDIILNSSKNVRGDQLPYFYNKNKVANKDKPTQYVFGILVDNTHFEYSFSHNADRIFEEQLIEFLPDQQIDHFHRKYNPHTDKYDWSKLSADFQNEASITLKEFIVKKNNLFLSAASNLPEDSQSRLSIADKLYFWFKDKINIVIKIAPPSQIDSLALIKENRNTEAFFLNVLDKADFLIKGFNIKALKNDAGDGESILLANTYHDGIDDNGDKIKVKYDFLKEESTGTQQLLIKISHSPFCKKLSIQKSPANLRILLNPSISSPMPKSAACPAKYTLPYANS